MGVAAALTPRVRTMVICDRLRESKTEAGVFDLKGVRPSIFANAIPFSRRKLWLFMHLSSPRSGLFPGYVRVVNDDNNKTVFYAHLDPIPVFDVGSGIMAVYSRIRYSFPEPGKYSVQVWFFQEVEADVLKGEMSFEVMPGEI
jgi:hypothetical protein